MVEGTVFNIQKYSIHDGPGIRTTVFFKGCPLNCWWCHNPESKSSDIQYTYSEDRCIECGDCGCRECEGCYAVCPGQAIEMLGRRCAVAEVVREVMQDLVFYEQSSGGVTISGGEPFVQIDFLDELLMTFKKKNIHTAVDTSGLTNWNNINRIIDNVDLFLYDIKHMNDEKHKLYTGVSNELILSNLKRISKMRKQVWIRIPIIPGINDDMENIIETIEFIKKYNFNQIYLLPYHNIMINKYKKLDMKFEIPEIVPPTRERMEEIGCIFKGYGLKVNIGG